MWRPNHTGYLPQETEVSLPMGGTQALRQAPWQLIFLPLNMFLTVSSQLMSKGVCLNYLLETKPVCQIKKKERERNARTTEAVRTVQTQWALLGCQQGAHSPRTGRAITASGLPALLVGVKNAAVRRPPAPAHF